jgi:hypothetical protein
MKICIVVLGYIMNLQDEFSFNVYCSNIAHTLQDQTKQYEFILKEQTL